MTEGGGGCYHNRAVNRDRAVAIVTSTGMILTWLATVASPRPEPALSPPPVAQVRAGATGRPDPTDALSFDVERESARLRVRMAEAPAPRRSGRDPFRFAERRPVEPARVRVQRSVHQPSMDLAAQTPVAAPPAIKLIGVAERATADGTVRTAVLSGAADVFLVGVNEQVLGRFTVVAIAAEAVEVVDSTTGQSLRLAMR